MRSLACPFFMISTDNSHIKTDSYTIGIIIDPSTTIKKKVLILRVLSFILSDKFAIYGTVNIVIALRNSYECDIAKEIKKIKHRNPYIRLHLLLSEHQLNRSHKPQHNTSKTKYVDIITSADNLTVIPSTFASGFFRKLLDEISKNCDLTLYHINGERYNHILQTIINYHHSLSLSIFDIM